MKTNDLILIGIVGLGAYMLLKGNNVITDVGTNLDTSGYYGNIGKTQAATSGITTVTQQQETTPKANLYNPIIYTKTTAISPERFVVDAYSGGGGVQDRYAQQTITTQEADKRRELAYYQNIFNPTLKKSILTK